MIKFIQFWPINISKTVRSETLPAPATMPVHGNCPLPPKQTLHDPPCSEGCLSGNFHHTGGVIEQSRQLTLFSGGWQTAGIAAKLIAVNSRLNF